MPPTSGEKNNNTEMVEKIFRTKMNPKVKVEREGTVAVNSN